MPAYTPSNEGKKRASPRPLPPQRGKGGGQRIVCGALAGAAGKGLPADLTLEGKHKVPFTWVKKRGRPGPQGTNLHHDRVGKPGQPTEGPLP